MSFKPKRPRGKGITNKSGPTVTLPERLLTTHDISRGHNYRVVPTVTPRGIAGTYTFSAPPTFHPPAAPAPTPPSPTLQEPDHPASDGLGHVGPSFSAKAARQYATWTTDVIPSLVPVYLHLLRTTQSLTRPPVPSVPLCVCGKKKLVLNIVCLHFDSLCSRQVHSCHCDPVSAQLVREGLFPCAPIAPTLAVDLKLLEFARLQFLTMVPNKSGWCEAMELFLRGMSFKFVAQDNLHRRFSNAYHWYCTLLDATQGHIQVVIEDSRADFLSTSPLCHDATALPPSSPVTSSSSPPGSPRSPPSSTFQSTSSSQPGSPSMSEDDLPSSTAPIPQSTSPSTSDAGSSTRQSTPPVAPRSSCFPPSPKWTRPSKYLRRCCGLCFGGTGQHRYDDSIADFICSIDACFTQKRNKNSKNPDYRDTERRHSNTVFLSEAEVEEMEEYVESIRARPAPAARRPTTGDDFVEDGMQIPVSVLEECGSSFVAADEKREKASTQFFADTGLMSLICRHDRVIFAVNMTHKGERQHYALALLKRLMAELPDDMTVGLLYDIACQLQRSMLKYRFLGDIFPRLLFAVSVFHAYGHAWPCQVIYHPRKCEGFGLSDGEGCERFWSAIRKLIPTLRISGYFQRLYTLDLHIKFLTSQAHATSGEWLARRWKMCHKRKVEAEKGLRKSGKALPFLREQWALQVTAQTKPMPRRSKHKGRQAVLSILTLDASIVSEQRIVDKLGRLLAAGRVDFQETSDQLTESNKRLQRLQDLRRAKVNSLGISETTQLRRLRDDAFLRARMNALAIKQRLRDRLRQRKFELEKLERSYRRTINETKTHTHIQNALDRRAPTIQKLAKSYNDLCASMRELVRKRKAPRGAICPEPIPDGGLWKLDVDDTIWQDIGLDDDTADDAPPPWLKDEQTRLGIRHMLDLDRINEEERRVLHESISLQELACEEWLVIQNAKATTDHVDMLYQLERRERDLCRLCYFWKKSTSAIHISADDNTWGPSAEQIDQAGVYERAEHVDAEPLPVDSESSDSGSESWATDGDLAEQVETVAFHDEYLAADTLLESEEHNLIEEITVPAKRRRIDG
ncbi:hypothetical protein HWV62_3126 [Athelia sp. TMB]|nr:hypothetical protein HWV62_3126 [Athelia sp. TMB]